MGKAASLVSAQRLHMLLPVQDPREGSTQFYHSSNRFANLALAPLFAASLAP